MFRYADKKNTPGLGHTTDYRLDNATLEVDLSEVVLVDESLEGLPASVEGHFETRDNPETGTRWIFKVHRLYQQVGGGDPLTGPPPPS